MSFVGDLFGGGAADAAADAANTSASAQREGLNYLRERERVPMHYRDQALAIMANELGIPMPSYELSEGANNQASNYNAGAPSQAGIMGRMANVLRDERLGFSSMPSYKNVSPAPSSLTDIAMQSPLYKAILDSQSAGEQAIARTASATGGLRGGSAISDIAGFGRDLQNKALLTAYNQKLGMLGGLTGLQSMAPQIAQQYGNIGETIAAGQVASANARQQGLGSALGLLGTIGGFAIGGSLGSSLGGVI